MLLRSLYVAFVVISLHSSTTCTGPGNSLLGETGCKINQHQKHTWVQWICVPRYWRMKDRGPARTGVACPSSGHKTCCSIIERVAMRANGEWMNIKTKNVAVYIQTKVHEGLFQLPSNKLSRDMLELKTNQSWWLAVPKTATWRDTYKI